MSEYWVSKNRYYCKYCEIYIADDAPSRRQHETGLRHKGNVERFVRGLYKASSQKKHDQDEEKREMARVEQAAQAAFAQDVGAGYAKAGSSSSSAASTSAPVAPRKPPPKPSNPWQNYSTAASLGYDDPDEEKRLAEAERRRMAGIAGEWEVVAQPLPTPEEPVVPSFEDGHDGKKRAAESGQELDTRQFKLRKKTLGTGLGEIYDPGLIPVKLKNPKKEDTLDGVDENGSSAGPSGSGSPYLQETATPLPKWTKLQWKRPGEEGNRDEGTQQEGGEIVDEAVHETVGEQETPSIKQDEVLDTSPSLKVEEKSSVKLEPTDSISPPSESGGLFRKRKVPAGGRGRRT
ncbi:hypothetical protein JAAARDRAFT_47417 [Jaapia argillacea MUCL 33604]|uniref:Matrin-type domain-containing protein n=1 Tax=Jaapia argillacea MUCL 33604 TaxID=933084 RepID=A0A067Q4E3_9AGAM|nr:hypothetical protein JAAARDRAFT_47417 [Jaapia argillacea MUCL 33604]